MKIGWRCLKRRWAGKKEGEISLMTIWINMKEKGKWKDFMKKKTDFMKKATFILIV